MSTKFHIHVTPTQISIHFLSSFIEIQFRGSIIHPFKVYNLMISDTLRVVQPSLQPFYNISSELFSYDSLNLTIPSSPRKTLIYFLPL